MNRSEPSASRLLTLFVRLGGVALACCGMTSAQSTPVSTPLWSRVVAPTDCYLEYVPHHLFTLARDDGVTVAAAEGIQRVAADGSVLWQVADCPTCTAAASVPSYIVDASPEAPTDTWIVESNGGGFSEPPLSLTLHRVDGTGTVTASAVVASGLQDASTRILADGAGVTTLLASYRASGLPRLHWIRHEPGVLHIEREVTVGEFALGLTVEGVWATAEGGVLAAIAHRQVQMCFPSQPHPCDTTQELLLLRLDAQGNELWRLQVDGVVPRISVQPDGSAWVAHRSHGIAQVSTGGQLSELRPVAGLMEDEEMFSIHGPVAGHLALATSEGLRLVDLAGRLRASRLMGSTPFWSSSSLDNLVATQGFFLLPTLWSGADCTVAQLLDPRTLAVRRILRHNGSCDTQRFDLADARVHGDGSVYVSGVMSGEACNAANDSELQLLRFGLPGTPAGGLLFRDDFGA